METLTELQTTVLSLAKKFAQRQSVVLEAMRDLRPDLTKDHERIETQEEWIAFKREIMKKPNPGYWGENSEWEYILHGPGCRLTHVYTGEVIEWDFGELNSFNIDWFSKHLQSLLIHDVYHEALLFMKSILPDAERINELSEDDFMQQLWEWRKQHIEPVLEQLCELGYLKKGNSYSYTLMM